MRWRIFHRLFGAFLFIAGSAMVLLALSTQWRLNRDFLTYVNALDEQQVREVAARLSEGQWPPQPRDWPRLWRDSGAAEVLERGGAQPPTSPANRPSDGRRGPPAEPRAPPPPPPPGPDAPDAPLALERRTALLSPDRQHLFGRRDLRGPVRELPVRHGERVVGLLIWEPLRRLTGSPAAELLQRQQRDLLLSVGILMLLAAAVAALLARNFARPIKAIAEASDRLAGRDFAVAVDIDRSDEFGDLARSFNHRARSLAEFDAARNRSIAATAHELRTPLTVMKGQLEAMIDGVRKLDDEGLLLLSRRVDGLTALVDDLNLLARADVGSLTFNMRPVGLLGLVRDVVTECRPLASAAGVELVLGEVPDKIRVYGDPQRLNQLVTNLIDNSLAYTDPGGRVQVSLTVSGDQAVISVEDSAPGVSDEELEKLGEPFFRGAAAIRRQGQGSGLGLAIAGRIVAGHRGEITFAHAAPGGLAVHVALPRMI